MRAHLHRGVTTTPDQAKARYVPSSVGRVMEATILMGVTRLKPSGLGMTRSRSVGKPGFRNHKNSGLAADASPQFLLRNRLSSRLDRCLRVDARGFGFSGLARLRADARGCEHFPRCEQPRAISEASCAPSLRSPIRAIQRTRARSE